MEFFVNGNKIDITLEQEKTVGDVLKSFEAECAKNNATTIQIILNDTKIDAAEFDTVCGQPLEERAKLELTVVSQDDVLAAFETNAKTCGVISKQLQELPVKLQTGKDKEVNAVIAELADLIEGFCHTASLSSLFPARFKPLVIEEKSFGDFFADFTQILNDFEQAIATRDTVLIGDLAEYEISPKLEAIANAIKEL